MKAITIRAMIKNSSIPATLIRAVVKQLYGMESFRERAKDIVNHGIDGGYGGFIYHKDTVKFTKKHKKAIMEMAKDQANEFGMNVFDMIAGFNCFRGEYQASEIAELIYKPFNWDNSDQVQVYNALSWYAGEEICRLYVDMVESEDY